jgi:hypothetical protein
MSFFIIENNFQTKKHNLRVLKNVRGKGKEDAM